MTSGTGARSVGDRPPRATRSPHHEMLVLLAGSIGAALVWWVAPAFARRLDAVLPLAMTVRSLGASYPSFELAFPYTLRALALSALLAALVARFLPTFATDTGQRAGRYAPFAAVAGITVAFGMFWYFGRPYVPLANHRLHWVDILYHDRTTNFVYTLLKPFHIAFYDVPYVWNALIGAACIALVYLIGRRLFPSPWVPVLMAGSLLGSGLFLMSADIAEDVKLNVAVLLVASYVYLRRWPTALGIMLFLVTLGRPTFILLTLAVVVTELALGPPRAGPQRSIRARLRALVDDRMLPRALAIAGALFVVWHGFLLAMGWSWVWRNGQFLTTDLIGGDVERFPVDGFLISPFSGAYVLHALWMYPLAILVASAVVAWRFASLPDQGRRFFLLAWAFTVLSLAFLEWQPIQYYNVRYISYMFPLVLIAGWLVLSTRPRSGRTVLPAGGGVVLLALAPLTIEQTATETRARAMDIPVVTTFHDRFELRSLVGDDPIAVAAGTSGPNWVPRDMLSYVLRRGADEIDIVDPMAPSLQGLLYVEAGMSAPDGEIVYESGDVRILRLEQSDPP